MLSRQGPDVEVDRWEQIKTGVDGAELLWWVPSKTVLERKSAQS
jgi:hypothetical protein